MISEKQKSDFKTVVVAVVVNVGKIAVELVVGFIHIFFQLKRKIPIEGLSGRWRIFSLFRVVVALAKKSDFSDWEDSGKLLAKCGCCGVFFKNGTTESILHNPKL